MHGRRNGHEINKKIKIKNGHTASFCALLPAVDAKTANAPSAAAAAAAAVGWRLHNSAIAWPQKSETPSPHARQVCAAAAAAVIRSTCPDARAWCLRGLQSGPTTTSTTILVIHCIIHRTARTRLFRSRFDVLPSSCEIPFPRRQHDSCYASARDNNTGAACTC